MNEFITTTHKDFEIKTLDSIDKSEKPKILFVCVNGSLNEEDFVLQNNTFVSEKRDFERYGKVEIYNDRELYYIKSFRGGRAGEIVPDPYGLLSKDTDLSLQNEQRGGRFCEYIPVKQEIFVQYRQYLLTRQPILFKGVENAIKNGERI